MISINCRGRLIPLDTPKVMGILNVTDDSFYGESRVDPQGALDKAGQMLEEGATFLDIGGQSTRPGSVRVGETEETDRVVPVIEALIKHYPDAILSIDTYYSSVALTVVKAGACIVNDISGGNVDAQMISTVASLHVPYIGMHMKGTPEIMHKDPQYEDVTKEVIQYLAALDKTCTDEGIHDVILDPGFGFSKTRAHNFQLLSQLELLGLLQRPILVGLSRKSTIFKTLQTTAEKALNGTTVLNTIALMKGAHILRVHDVREAVEAIQLVGAVKLAD